MYESFDMQTPPLLWYSVDTKLPPVGKNVLMFRKESYPTGGTFMTVAEGNLEADGTWTQYRWNVKHIDDVVYWAEMPTGN